jgi:tetratricopeptide (TPR) repeat protein
MSESEYYNKGRGLVRKGKYDEAIELFTAGLEESPDNRDLLDCRAAAWKTKGEPDKAIADYTRIIALRPDSYAGWYSRGTQYHEMGEYDKAIADFTEAIDRASGHSFNWLERGISYCGKGDLDAALEDCNQAVALDPEYPRAFINRGIVRRKQGDFDGAICDFTQAIIYHPENDWALGQRGYCWFTKREFEKAIANYSAAIAIRPEDAVSWVSRGVCYWNMGGKGQVLMERVDKAYEDFDKACELAPDYAYAHWCRGEASRIKAKEEIGWARAAVEGRMKDGAEGMALMRQLEQTGHEELVPAFGGFLGALRSNRTEAEEIIFNFAGSLADYSLREAVEDFTKAIALEPDNADAFYNRGLCYQMWGKPNAALADFEQTLVLNPGHADAAKKRAELRQAAGLDQKAQNRYISTKIMKEFI